MKHGTYGYDSSEVQPAWCKEHDDFAWLYGDGSGSCFHTCIVEMGGGECRIVALPKSVERAIARIQGEAP